MKPAIAVRGLSKRYRLGEGARAPYRTFRETLAGVVSAPMRRLRRAARPTTREMWALRDVSFDVRPGEVLGVIGRNGAGKSTLLKTLSRIVAPTEGEITLCGRVGSLLEVGTGFHPELTGRENIYLNGAILGMSRREIQRKFDEIVDFSEVEQFLDTPVKRYSSGMYMKLAFAVASHLEPEILLVDEVLAVGDTQFQKKCLGKMGEVSRHGRTVLFVSHNMTAVKALCTRAVLIAGGTVAADGDVDDVVNDYLAAGTDMAKTGVIPADAMRQQDARGRAYFRSVRLTDRAGTDVSQLYFGQPFRVGFKCEVLKEVPDAHFEISISTADGTQVTYSTTVDGGVPSRRLAAGMHEVWADLDVQLLPHTYTIDLGIHQDDGTTLDFVQRTLDFHVLRVAEEGEDHYRWCRTRGFVRAATTWTEVRPAS
ncbi:MAG TPA: ABC transporter ATP-binding protein [Gemmataceae bacterium]|nr:ABC transporter ATP-binding protein [Gemmataceae bacterium]